MTDILVPTIADVVRCIGDSIEKTIAPALTRQTERSAITTIRHLLRLVERRVEDEGQVLWDELKMLRGLLPQVADYLELRKDAVDLANRIRASVATTRDPEVYPSLTLLAGELGVLRKQVTDALKIVRDAGAEGAAIHEAIRQYIVWQIEQEGRIVEPAFRGHGARR